VQRKERDGYNVVDTVVMGYWIAPSPAFVYIAMLASTNGNGSCGAWSELLDACLRIQGNTSASIGEIKSIFHPKLFLVNVWDKSPSTLGDVGLTVGYVPGLISGNGIPAQNNPSPPPEAKAFQNHFIVRFNAKFYDPSYGGPIYNTQLDHENAALRALITNSSAPFIADIQNPSVAELTYTWP
jgi:hypothetical protein